MKEKLKNNKGITLVALVITIIILLILAMVSISLVMNTRIINHANNAVTSYKEAEENEQKQLDSILSVIGKYIKPSDSNNQGGSTESGGTGSNNTTSDNTVNNPSTDTEWWKLTEKEATEIEDIGSGTYLIADNGISGSHEGTRIVILAPNNEVVILTAPNEEYIFFMSEEIAAGILGSETNYDLYKWYKVIFDNSYNIQSVEEYTGTSPIQKNEFTTIKSETYLDRMINSFGK